MARTHTTQPPTRGRDFLRLLEPFGTAVSVAAQPGALTLGVLAGGLCGALAGMAAGLIFVRSPVGVAVAPVSAILILIVWSVAAGGVALAAWRQAEEQAGRIGPSLREALRRAPALVAVVLPLFALIAALAVVQVGVFVLTRAPDGVIAPDRPVALIAVVFTLLFLIDALALAALSVGFWILVPYVIVDGEGAARAYSSARDAFWRAPGFAIAAMATVLALASAGTTALFGLLAAALVLAASTQLIGANELVLLRFSEPLVQGSFLIPVGDFVAVVVMATGLGAALGAAIGFGHTFGVAGGAGLRRALAPDRSGGMI
jgi:hypothetical protein